MNKSEIEDSMEPKLLEVIRYRLCESTGKFFFRSNIFMKQKLTFLVTFPDYFRDYRTILETFSGDSLEK